MLIVFGARSPTREPLRFFESLNVVTEKYHWFGSVWRAPRTYLNVFYLPGPEGDIQLVGNLDALSISTVLHGFYRIAQVLFTPLHRVPGLACFLVFVPRNLPTPSFAFGAFASIT